MLEVPQEPISHWWTFKNNQRHNYSLLLVNELQSLKKSKNKYNMLDQVWLHISLEIQNVSISYIKGIIINWEKMEEEKMGKLQKEKAQACIFTMNLVKGTESDVGIQQVPIDD